MNAHMFRHTLAQAIVDQGNLKVAQDISGHRHLETTVAIYASTDQRAMLEAVRDAKSLFDFDAEQASALRTMAQAAPTGSSLPPANRYVFAYDEETLQELDQAATWSADEDTR